MCIYRICGLVQPWDRSRPFITKCITQYSSLLLPLVVLEHSLHEFGKDHVVNHSLEQRTTILMHVQSVRKVRNTILC